MEKKLKGLFDLQKYENNPRLQKMIDESVSRYPADLSDDELELVSAAGDTSAPDGVPGGITGDFTGNYAKESTNGGGAFIEKGYMGLDDD